jgi:Flp pilus assembly protein TadD
LDISPDGWFELVRLIALTVVFAATAVGGVQLARHIDLPKRKPLPPDDSRITEASVLAKVSDYELQQARNVAEKEVVLAKKDAVVKAFEAGDANTIKELKALDAPPRQ